MRTIFRSRLEPTADEMKNAVVKLITRSETAAQDLEDLAEEIEGLGSDQLLNMQYDITMTLREAAQFLRLEA